MIELQGISLRFGTNAVFSHASFTLPDAGVVLLMGASGTGKTTLLRILAGLQKPDDGSVTGLTDRHVTVSFQEPRLLPWLTAEENVALVSDSDAAGALLSRLGMTDAKHDLARTLSGGQQQRVSLARAFAAGRDVVLLDEPFAGLDEENKRLAAELIRTAKLAVIVTHDASDAPLLAADLVVYL